MRQIKFRAWDRAANKMIIDGVDFELRCLSIDWGVHDPYFGIGYPDYYKKHFEIMQFTGLTDKNGVDIYEGDIVKTRYTSNTPKVGQVYSQPFRLNWSVKHSSLANQDLFAYSRPDCSVEVIGNIHENQELLTK